MGELLNIKWEDFSSQICDAFQVMQKNEDLRDVTLVCDDGEVDAHRLILFCGSEFFQRVLNMSKHQHPLLYIRGVKIAILQAILDFLYIGEVRVAQEDLTEFFSIAKDLKIKGLTENYNNKLLVLAKRELAIKKAKEVNLPPHDLVEVKIKEESGYTDEESEQEGSMENPRGSCVSEGQVIPNKELLEVGSIFNSKEEVMDQVDSYSESNFSPLRIEHNSVRNNLRWMSYRCPYGCLRKSSATGARQVQGSKYVGCPVRLSFCQYVFEGPLSVKTSQLEHQGHEIGEEHYSKYRKRLSKDQEDAVGAFLQSNPSNPKVAEFLHDLTGKQFSTKQARFVVNKVKRNKDK